MLIHPVSATLPLFIHCIFVKAFADHDIRVLPPPIYYHDHGVGKVRRHVDFSVHLLIPMYYE